MPSVCFEASKQTDGIHIEWITASEKINYGFAIERLMKNDRKGIWQQIGLVPGNGTLAKETHYKYVDQLAENWLNISNVFNYRLKQIDTDGSFSYSKVISLAFNLPENYKILQNYPNPLGWQK